MQICIFFPAYYISFNALRIHQIKIATGFHSESNVLGRNFRNKVLKLSLSIKVANFIDFRLKIEKGKKRRKKYPLHWDRTRTSER